MEKQKDILGKAATTMETGDQMKPLAPKHKQAELRTSKHAHKKDHTHTHAWSLKHLQSHDLRPGALKLARRQSKATGAPIRSEQQPIRGWGGHFGASGPCP